MFLVKIFSRLPFWILYGISDFLFFMCYYVVGYRRKMVAKNLSNAFPEKPVEERKQIEKEFYKNLCDYSVEMLKLLTMSRAELDKRMVFYNTSVVLKHFENNQSIMQLASHQFNWEWLLVKGSLAYPVSIDFVYQPVNSKFFERFSLLSRTRFGAYPIKRDEVAREAAKRRHVLKSLAIVADQYPGYGRDKKYTTTFLNQETVFFYAANQIALLTQYPVFFYATKKVSRGYYESTVVEISNPPYPATSEVVIENYVRAVEKLIIENPSGWLWSHNRWKKRHLKNKIQQPTITTN